MVNNEKPVGNVTAGNNAPGGGKNSGAASTSTSVRDCAWQFITTIGLSATIVIVMMMLVQAVMFPGNMGLFLGPGSGTGSSVAVPSGAKRTPGARSGGSFDSLAAYSADGTRLEKEDLNLTITGNVASWDKSDRFMARSDQVPAERTGEDLPWLTFVGPVGSEGGCTGAFVGPNVLVTRLSCITNTGDKAPTVSQLSSLRKRCKEVDAGWWSSSRSAGCGAGSIAEFDDIAYAADRIYIPRTAADAIKDRDGMDKYILRSTDAWAIITVRARVGSWLNLSTTKPEGNATEYCNRHDFWGGPELAKANLPVLDGDAGWYMAEGWDEGVLVNGNDLVGLVTERPGKVTDGDGNSNDNPPQPVIAVTDAMKAAVAQLTAA